VVVLNFAPQILCQIYQPPASRSARCGKAPFPVV
jgi:hypothetical protein